MFRPNCNSYTKNTGEIWQGRTKVERKKMFLSQLYAAIIIVTSSAGDRANTEE